MAKKNDTIAVMLYKDTDPIEVLYNPKAHTYFADGVRVPNVTTITGSGGSFLGNWVAKVNAEYALKIFKQDYFDGDGVIVPIDELETVLEMSKGEHRRISTHAKDIGTEVHSWIGDYLKEGVKKLI